MEKIMYCVEHADNDMLNAYFSTEQEAIDFATRIIEEIPDEHIWVSRGLFTGSYVAEELVVDFDKEV